jgi:glycosyltransferase involved in cell wall biosynthesis
MYRSEHLVAETLDSLLAQSYEDFAIVAIDDCSPDATYDAVRAHVGDDPRVTAEANGQRLGNCGNSNRVLARALELHPDCELFAWASDNDLREPTWLSAAVKALDEDPAAVLAYSRGGKVVDGVRVPPRAERTSAGPQGARGVDRMTATLRGRRDDAMIYGLQRVQTLIRVGAKPRVMAPDVLFLSHLALYGTFVRLPDGLWYRGTRRTGRSPRRQRATVFGTPPPVWSWLPVQLQRAAWLTRELVIGSRRPPGVGRVGAMALVGRFCLEDMRQEIAERVKRLKRHRNRALKQLRSQRARRAKSLRRLRVRAGRAVRRRFRARSR